MVHPANIERIPILRRGDLLIDPQCCTATQEGRVLRLFPKEFGTLYLLAQYPNWVLSPQQIYGHVWQEEPINCDHIVRNTICQLRRKLVRPGPIQTVVGYGYKFVIEQKGDEEIIEG